MNELQIIWAILGALILVGGILSSVRYSAPFCTWAEAWSITAAIFTAWILVSMLVAGYTTIILWLWKSMGQWSR